MSSDTRFTETDVLHKLYNTGFWKMKVDEEKAIRRFNEMITIFKETVKQHDAFSFLNKKKVKILDLAGGTGIAGVAFGKALSEIGVKAYLAVIDVRDEDLKHVDKWIEYAGLSTHLEYNTISGDIRRIDEVTDDRYDIALLWGSSMPHFNVNDYLMILSGLSNVCNPNCVLWVEQWDMAGKIMLMNNYLRTVFVQTGKEGEGVIEIHVRYDPVEGTVSRCVYKIPGFEYIGCFKVRYWDIASLMGFAKVFFKKIDYYYPHISSKLCREGFIAWSPRKISLLPKDFVE